MTASIRSKPHFVLAYSGCDQDVGEAALESDGPDGLAASKQGDDWLGAGIYFWENDPLRARNWALENHLRQVRREKDKGTPAQLRRPFAVGAVLNLGTCLDLTTIEGVALLQEGYRSYINDFRELQKKKPTLRIPKNETMTDGRVRAFLDYQVINYTCRFYEKEKRQSIDTVRALFPEGDQVYAGAQFQAKTHTQICVRKPAHVIVAYFRIHGMDFS